MAYFSTRTFSVTLQLEQRDSTILWRHFKETIKGRIAILWPTSADFEFLALPHEVQEVAHGVLPEEVPVDLDLQVVLKGVLLWVGADLRREKVCNL